MSVEPLLFGRRERVVQVVGYELHVLAATHLMVSPLVASQQGTSPRSADKDPGPMRPGSTFSLDSRLERNTAPIGGLIGRWSSVVVDRASDRNSGSRL
jgi:hypothetical protein